MAKQPTSVDKDSFVIQPDKGASLSEELREMLSEGTTDLASEQFISENVVLNSPVVALDDNSRQLEGRQADAVLANPKANRAQIAHYQQLKAALHLENESQPSMTYVDGRRTEIPASTRDSSNALDANSGNRILKVLLGDSLYAQCKEWARRGNIRKVGVFLGPEIYALLRSEAAFEISDELKEKFEREDNDDSSDISQAVSKLFGQELLMEARRMARFNKCSLRNIVVAFAELVVKHRERKLQESINIYSGMDEI